MRRAQPVETLCDFDAIATSLIQRSLPVEGEFDVVALPGKGGKDPADYAGLDVAGKVVLTSVAPSRVAELAIREHGAAGILFDGMAAGGRTELDLPDARQYTSFWWAGEAQPLGWGFVLSPRQGRGLARHPGRPQTGARAGQHPQSYLSWHDRGGGGVHPRRAWGERNPHGEPPVPPPAKRKRQRLGRGRAAGGRCDAGATHRPGHAACSEPRHPLHLGAGDDRHVRLAGRAGGRGAQWALARRVEPGYGRRGSMPDQRHQRVCQPARGRRIFRRPPAELAE